MLDRELRIARAARPSKTGRPVAFCGGNRFSFVRLCVSLVSRRAGKNLEKENERIEEKTSKVIYEHLPSYEISRSCRLFFLNLSS